MPKTPQSDPANHPRANDEPALTQEEDIPSDGKDEKGEEMIKELGREKPDPQLSDPDTGKA